jgi:DNA modification methylase
MQRESLLNIPIDNVFPYFKNPRKNNKAIPKVAASLKKHGYVKVSVVVDETDTLLTGHTTLAAMKSIEWAAIPEVTRITGLTPSQKLSYRIADNKTGEYAEWDDKLLMENFEEMKSIDGDHFDITDTGYTQQEYDRLQHSLFPPEATEDPFKVDVNVVTTIKPGDLIHLGRHTILCGDSTSETDVARLYRDEIAAIAFTSPPYNAGKEGWLGSSDSKYEGDADDKGWQEYLSFLRKFMELHLDKCCYLFLNIQFLRGNKLAIIDLLHEFKMNLAEIIIWDKDNAQPAMAENILNSEFEFIFVFKEEVPANRRIGTRNFRGTLSNVYHGPSQHNNEFAGIHSATFPMHLPNFIVGNFTKDGEVVFEPFLGLGTTLIACEQLGRTCYGMEMDPKYCEVICRRWEKITGKKRE